eukprot:1392506-Lingulodinium_polyedra.AAC.1
MVTRSCHFVLPGVGRVADSGPTNASPIRGEFCSFLLWASRCSFWRGAEDPMYVRDLVCRRR